MIFIIILLPHLYLCFQNILRMGISLHALYVNDAFLNVYNIYSLLLIKACIIALFCCLTVQVSELDKTSITGGKNPTKIGYCESLSLVHTCDINISVREDKRQNNETQWNVLHKHRHKLKHKHKTSSIIQDKTKEISKEYISCFVFFAYIEVGVFDLLCLSCATEWTRF